MGGELGMPLSGFVAVVCSFNVRTRAPRIFVTARELVGDAERLVRPLEANQVDLQDHRLCSAAPAAPAAPAPSTSVARAAPPESLAGAELASS